MNLLTDITHIYCVIEQNSFTESWYNFAKGGALSPHYVDFFIEKNSALASKHQLEKENPELEFDVMKTQASSFSKHWTKSPHWSHN